ncbi:TetR/AcrR family transcriptional regulator [Cryptosporangium sp. NPDC048952]|uniref:TetR/AcrR family transcriptional regulator n=1 Tax=Cryptosporangium sp. NPDC048952 TaxID=3363961 RepID=UPI003713AD3F
MRADAQRNYDQILAAAEVEIARSGAGASLEEIARRAGVGSATLHRHFPSRQALLDAVFHDRIEAMCAQASAYAQADDAGAALAEWLRALAVYGATTRGLAASMLAGGMAVPSGSGCEQMLADAGASLLMRAQVAGAVRAEVSIVDLLTLVNAVSLATENHPDTADRLTTLALSGIYPAKA